MHVEGLASDVIAETGALLADPGSILAVPSHLLLCATNLLQKTEIIAKDVSPKPSLWDLAGPMLGSMTPSGPRHPFDILPTSATAALWSALIGHNVATWRHATEKAALIRLIDSFTLQRPTLSLSEQEKALTRAMAALYAYGAITADGWASFLSRMVWCDGKCIQRLPKADSAHKLAHRAREVLTKVVTATLPAHATFLAEVTQLVAEHRNQPSFLGQAVSAALHQGARWLIADDLPTSRVLTISTGASPLTLGYLGDTGNPIRYSGNASLVTIAAPGTGKTQAQVVPNLLAYPGSVFVLDVKGELWEQTAAHRQRFGAVYRFSPVDAGGRSHCYNPFDAIGTDPVQAANACEVFANQLIPDNPNAKDPYWDRRARDFVWAFAMVVALTHAPEQRNLLAVANMLSINTSFGEDGEGFENSPLNLFCLRLDGLRHRLNMPELANTATALRDGIRGTRLGSIFDSARSHLNGLARTPSAIAATAHSDWSPLDLRSKPGTSVYLSFRPGEMRAFAGIIRLIFQQHADALTRTFAPGPNQLPVTFFLDEMPQLGPLSSLTDLMDIGRGAGVRLWIFAQYLGQLREAYGNRADGIVGAAQVRCFMQPDNDAATFIAPLLGKQRNVLTGEERPLAEPHELSSRTFGDHTILLTRDEHPALLTNRFAYRETPDLIRQPPPEVPKVTRPPPSSKAGA